MIPPAKAAHLDDEFPPLIAHRVIVLDVWGDSYGDTRFRWSCSCGHRDEERRTPEQSRWAWDEHQRITWRMP